MYGTVSEVEFENGNRASLVAAEVDSDPARLLAELALDPNRPPPATNLEALRLSGKHDGSGRPESRCRALLPSLCLSTRGVGGGPY